MRNLKKEEKAVVSGLALCGVIRMCDGCKDGVPDLMVGCNVQLVSYLGGISERFATKCGHDAVSTGVLYEYESVQTYTNQYRTKVISSRSSKHEQTA